MRELSAVDWFDLDYCAPHGIPLSVYRGRIVALGEAQWLEGDYQAAALWQARENARCTGCGLDLRETTKAENDDAYTAKGIRCHACKAMDLASRDAAGIDEPDPQAGMRFRVTRDDETDG